MIKSTGVLTSPSRIKLAVIVSSPPRHNLYEHLWGWGHLYLPLWGCLPLLRANADEMCSQEGEFHQCNAVEWLTPCSLEQHLYTSSQVRFFFFYKHMKSRTEDKLFGILSCLTLGGGETSLREHWVHTVPISSADIYCPAREIVQE